MKNNKQKICSENALINYYPGFSLSFVETEKGNYINITLKNRIIRDETILDYIRKCQFINNKNSQKIIKEELLGHSFTVPFAKKKYNLIKIPKI